MIAAYQRISRADGDLGKDGKDKSNSIENQKELIQRYISCKESLQNVPVMDFVDDGYTGSNFDRCKSKLNNQKRKNPLRALCREPCAQQRSRQKISYTGRGSQRVWCRPLSKMSLCMMEGASWYGSNMSRAYRIL